MPVDIHLYSPNGEGLAQLGDGTFETGDWTGFSPKTCDEAIGGRVYLHASQVAVAWHGGTVVSWRIVEGVKGKLKSFRFKADVPLVACPKWDFRYRAVNRRR